MNHVSNMLQQQGFTLVCTDKAIETLAEAGFDPDFGARPVKRAIQRDVLNALSKQLLAGTISKDKPVTVDSENGIIIFRNTTKI